MALIGPLAEDVDELVGSWASRAHTADIVSLADGIRAKLPANAVLSTARGSALTEDAKKRMLHMHIAVTVGLLGFLGTAKSIYDFIQMLRGVQFPHPIAVQEKAAMSVLLLVFVILCVRSFINARRARA